jgi:hypothetical protein
MQSHGTIDSKTFAIGVLSVTACVLFVGLILISQPPARAMGMNDRGADYVMLTQQLSPTSEGLVVIDAAAKQMIIYAYDYNNRSLDILRRVNLEQLPKARASEEGARGPAHRGRQ